MLLWESCKTLSLVVASKKSFLLPIFAWLYLLAGHPPEGKPSHREHQDPCHQGSQLPALLQEGQLTAGGSCPHQGRRLQSTYTPEHWTRGPRHTVLRLWGPFGFEQMTSPLPPEFPPVEVGCLKWIGSTRAPWRFVIFKCLALPLPPSAGLPGSARGWAGSRGVWPRAGCGRAALPKALLPRPSSLQDPEAQEREHGGQDWGPCRPGRPSGRSGSECCPVASCRSLPSDPAPAGGRCRGSLPTGAPFPPPPWRPVPTHQLRRGLGSGKGTERREVAALPGARPAPPAGPRPAWLEARAAPPTAPRVRGLPPPAAASPGALSPAGHRASASGLCLLWAQARAGLPAGAPSPGGRRAAQTQPALQASPFS